LNSDTDDFICPYCPVRFNQTRGCTCTALHKFRFHPTGKQVFVCSSCGKSFINRTVLNRHRQQACQVASIITTKSEPEEQQDQEFDTHQLPAQDKLVRVYHESEKNKIKKEPLVCLLCSYTSFCSSTLTQHTQIHSMGKEIDSFKCSNCDLTFSKLKNKIKHEKCHEDEFICPYCPVGFNQSHGLALHKSRAHPTEEQSLVCRSCGKSFVSRFSLNRHRPSCQGESTVRTDDKCQPDEHENREFDTNKLPAQEEGKNWAFECTEAYQLSKEPEENNMSTVVKEVPKPMESDDFGFPSSPTTSTTNGNEAIGYWVQGITSDPLAIFDCSAPSVIPTTILKMETGNL